MKSTLGKSFPCFLAFCIAASAPGPGAFAQAASAAGLRAPSPMQASFAPAAIPSRSSASSIARPLPSLISAPRAPRRLPRIARSSGFQALARVHSGKARIAGRPAPADLDFLFDRSSVRGISTAEVEIPSGARTPSRSLEKPSPRAETADEPIRARMRRLQRGDSALLWFMIAADVAAAAAVFLLGPGPSALIRTAELALPVLFGIAASDFGGRMGGIPKGMTPLGEDERPELHRLVNDLSDKASLPRPQILLDAAPGVNAAGARMAGRDIVAFTPDLLKALRPAEVAAVAGHELTHIRHGDMALYTALPYFLIAAMVVHSTLFGSFAAGAAAVAAHWVLATRVLRDREFLADLGSASLAGSPEGVAGTLIHLDLWARMIPGRAWAPVAPPALSDALSSHPSSYRRISAILGLLGRAPKAPRARLWPFGKSVKSAAERFSAFLENPDAFIRRRAALSMRRLAFRTQSPDILRAASLAVSAALLKEEDAALRASLSGLLARLQARARAVKG